MRMSDDGPPGVGEPKQREEQDGQGLAEDGIAVKEKGHSSASNSGFDEIQQIHCAK